MKDEKRNTGNWNTGNWNTGNLNTGNRNTGDWNTGNWNTGNLNTGNLNTGNRNTGNWNTGDLNTGDLNTGDLNTGNRNTGNRNTGDRNTGDRNTGDLNTGDWNTGNWNTGDLNTTEPTVRLFNIDSGLKFGSENHNKLRNLLYSKSIPLCEWISASNMTDEEKKENAKTWETTQGYLKVNDISKNNNELSKYEEEFLRSLPNFDEAILLECTGIDLSKKTVKITIDGKDIQISKEEFENIKAQFCS